MNGQLFPVSGMCDQDMSDTSPESSGSGRRQRMVTWLENEINRNTPGVEWVDKERKIFRVVWKRVTNKEWSEDDGLIFKVNGLYNTFQISLGGFDYCR